MTARAYPERLGLTVEQILSALSFHPMTRRDLEEDFLAVTTAGLHLPRLIERGLIEANTWRERQLVYAITAQGRDALSVIEKERRPSDETVE